MKSVSMKVAAPCPTDIRTIVIDPNTLGPALVDRLLQLTNGKRHDPRDDGSTPGSALRKHLLAYRRAKTPFPDNSWVVLATELGSLDPHVVGWGLVVRRWDGKAQAAFYVDPKRRRTGVARVLLDRAVGLCCRHGMLALRGEPWNKASAAFFEALGFTTVVPYVSGESIGCAELAVDPRPWPPRQ